MYIGLRTYLFTRRGMLSIVMRVFQSQHLKAGKWVRRSLEARCHQPQLEENEEKQSSAGEDHYTEDQMYLTNVRAQHSE